MDGWTEVTYRRRRQRTSQKPRQQPRDRSYGWSRDRMDRAPSLRYRRDNFPLPNQPVPPPGATRYTGRRYRSYADAVRQPTPRWYPPRGGGQDLRRQPADPQFGLLIRKFHALIKTVHHLQNVSLTSGKAEPRMISRMVEVLSTMIKPAAPSTRTRDLIEGNARNWGYNTYLILKEHYEKCLDDFLQDLTHHLIPGWKEAFQVAVRWARRNLPRISRDVIEHAEALIAARVDEERGDPLPAPIPPLTTTTRTESPREPVRQVTTATMTDEVDYQFHQPGGGDRPQPVTHPSPAAASPRQQRTEKRTRWREFPDDSTLQDSEPDVQQEGRDVEAPPHTPTHSELEALFDELHAEEEREAATTSTPQEPGGIPAQVYREDSHLDNDGEEFVDSFERFTQPGPRRYRVRRHPNSQRKLTDWYLEAERKWLIIGDSNLCNFPEFFNKDLQIDSFPGAHFRHAQALMEKTEPHQDLVVEKIILSFGINSRANKSKETTIKTVQAALRATKRKFPYADIWIPLVNYSTQLPTEEQDNLQILNEHVERNMPHIPLLPERKFRTQADDVHWTSETGTAIFNYWMDFLNTDTP